MRAISIFFLVSLFLCYSYANGLESLSAKPVNQRTVNAKFSNYCDAISDSFAEYNDNDEHLDIPEQLVFAKNICSFADLDFNQALILCKNHPAEAACQYIASMNTQESTENSVSYTKRLTINNLLTKLPLCEAAAESILGICNQKDANLQNVTAQIAKQSAHQLANASAIDICSNTA